MNADTSRVATGTPAAPTSRRAAREAAAGAGAAAPVEEAAPAGTPVTDASAEERCPQCGAIVPQRISWCSQCYADLRVTVPQPVLTSSTPGPTADGAASTDGPSTHTLSTDTPSTHTPSTHTLSTDTDEQDDAPERTADAEELDRISEAMLAQLAATPRTGWRGTVDAGLDGPGAKTAFIAAGTVLIAAVGFGLMYLVGALL